MTRIVNRAELKKINTFKPHAFEIVELVNNEIVCVAYITTSEQWKKFYNDYQGEKIWVMSVNEEENTAMMIIA